MNNTLEVHSTADPFYGLARLFRHDLDAGSPEQRTSRVASVLAVVLTFPMSIAGLIWLTRATDWTIFGRQWPMLLLVAALIILLGELKFYSIADMGTSSGTYGNAISTLDGVVIWSGLILLGTPVIWINLLLILIQLFSTRSYYRNHDTRWVLAQTLGLSTATATLLQMISLSAYHALGGQIPPAGLTIQAVLPGLAAVSLQMVLEMILLWGVYLGYTIWAMRKTLAPRLLARLPLLLFMNLIIPYLANLFAVPLAGIYVAHGVFFYLVFVLIFVLVGLLARRMSQAAEDSRSQSVQLKQLAAIGQAVLNAVQDPSALPSILTEYVPAMFTHARVGIWIGEQALLSLPPAWSPREQEPVRVWVSQQQAAKAFTARQALPWVSTGDHHPAITGPILDDETSQPLGGIYVELLDLGHSWNAVTLQRLLPSLQGLAAQIASALHQARVYQETLAHQKTQQELAIARQIQASFLPRELPQLPGWQICASLEPAREMAGDFYDLMPLPDGHLGILIADVADKGVGPALYMALSRTLIRTFASQNVTHPEIVLQSANERILHDADYGLFVTVFYGVLDPATGELVYANAGHNPPWVFEPAQPEPVLLTRTGMALGVEETVTWTKASVQLAPGSTILFYTDGATDSQNPAGEFFEEKRLFEAVQANLSKPAAEVHAGILADIRAFVKEAPQFDDITLIVIQRMPSP